MSLLDAARRAASAFSRHPEVAAVALGGSAGAGVSDEASDADLYLYLSAPLPVSARTEVAHALSDAPEVEGDYFGPADEWADRATGRRVDAMYRTTAEVEAELDRVLIRYEPRMGYSTCVWHSVRVGTSLFDRDGWYAALCARAAAPFPDALRVRIVSQNVRFLRLARSSFRYQMALAVERGDTVSVNHRTAAFLASVFDALFALNRETHPGEKRLLDYAEARCPLRPPGLRGDVEALIEASAQPAAALLARADALAAAMEALAAAEGLLSLSPVSGSG